MSVNQRLKLMETSLVLLRVILLSSCLHLVLLLACVKLVINRNYAEKIDTKSLRLLYLMSNSFMVQKR